MEEIVEDVKRVASLKYYCLGEPTIVRKDGDETSDWQRLDRMIEKSSSDASLIQHKPGFTGESPPFLVSRFCRFLSFESSSFCNLVSSPPGTHSLLPHLMSLKLNTLSQCVRRVPLFGISLKCEGKGLSSKRGKSK